jgi:hypothetical protein
MIVFMRVVVPVPMRVVVRLVVKVLADGEATSGQHMISVRKGLARDTSRETGGSGSGIAQCGVGVEHAGHEHVARRPAQRIEMEVLMAGRHA